MINFRITTISFLKKNRSISLGSLIFFCSFLLNFAQISILLNLLNDEVYGLWVTIFSVVGILSYADFGLLNGLRLKLTEYYSANRLLDFYALIKYGYFVSLIIGLVLVVVTFLIIQFTNVTFYLIGEDDRHNVYFSLISMSIGISLILFLRIIGVVHASMQKPHIEKFLILLGQIIFICSLLFLKSSEFNKNLFTISILYIISLALPLILANLLYFIKNFNNFFNMKISIIGKDIWSVNNSFLIIQLASLILYSTDNYIIGINLSPDLVTDYSLNYKYYGIIHIFFSMFISLHWQYFIDLLSKNKIKSIRDRVRLFEFLFLLTLLIMLLFYFLKDFVFKFWLGKIYPSENFINDLGFIIYFSLSSFATIYTYVVNASGDMKLQRNTYIFIGIINIPLSVILLNTKLKSSGVILASSICMLFLAINMYKQSNRILTK